MSGEWARFVGRFSGTHRALDGWMLARAPASPAQGLHRHELRYFNFSYLCMTRDLENMGLLSKLIEV